MGLVAAASIAAVATVAASTVSAVGQAKAAKAAAEGAENAQATIQGGVSRLTAFRQNLKTENSAYKEWQKQSTQNLVDYVNNQPLESHGYLDARRRLLNTQAATGSVRSGASQIGQSDLASRESEANFARQAAVNQLLSTQTNRSDALRAGTYQAEANLLGEKAGYQQGEANAEAAGTEAVYGGISGGLSGIAGIAGAYAGGGAGLGSAGTAAAGTLSQPVMQNDYGPSGLGTPGASGGYGYNTAGLLGGQISVAYPSTYTDEQIDAYRKSRGWPQRGGL